MEKTQMAVRMINHDDLQKQIIARSKAQALLRAASQAPAWQCTYEGS
jgi:hypothetical protein